ncbi:hypothetical protein CSHISOI_01077, partial [Colletotrichum shisoi]
CWLELSTSAQAGLPRRRRQLISRLSRFGLSLPGAPTKAKIRRYDKPATRRSVLRGRRRQIRFADSRSILEAPHPANSPTFSRRQPPDARNSFKVQACGTRSTLSTPAGKEPLGPRLSVILHHVRSNYGSQNNSFNAHVLCSAHVTHNNASIAFSSGSASRLLLSQIIPFGNSSKISWNYRCPLETNEPSLHLVCCELRCIAQCSDHLLSLNQCFSTSNATWTPRLSSPSTPNTPDLCSVRRCGASHSRRRFVASARPASPDATTRRMGPFPQISLFPSNEKSMVTKSCPILPFTSRQQTLKQHSSDHGDRTLGPAQWTYRPPPPRRSRCFIGSLATPHHRSIAFSMLPVCLPHRPHWGGRISC